MVDIVSKEVRSKMMSGIRGKNTKPELLVRRGLFAKGFRYRLHAQDLPGKPDLVFAKYRTVLFVNGCFWHGHNCHLFRPPATNTDFWETKIAKNRAKDESNKHLLLASGWKVVIVWECAMKGRKNDIPKLIQTVCSIIRLSSGSSFHEITGATPLMSNPTQDEING